MAAMSLWLVAYAVAKQTIAIFGLLFAITKIVWPLTAAVVRFLVVEAPTELYRWKVHRRQQRELRRLRRILAREKRLQQQSEFDDVEDDWAPSTVTKAPRTPTFSLDSTVRKVKKRCDAESDEEALPADFFETERDADNHAADSSSAGPQTPRIRQRPLASRTRYGLFS